MEPNRTPSLNQVVGSGYSRGPRPTPAFLRVNARQRVHSGPLVRQDGPVQRLYQQTQNGQQPSRYLSDNRHYRTPGYRSETNYLAQGGASFAGEPTGQMQVGFPPQPTNYTSNGGMPSYRSAPPLAPPYTDPQYNPDMPTPNPNVVNYDNQNRNGQLLVPTANEVTGMLPQQAVNMGNEQYRMVQETGSQWTHGQHAHTVPQIDQMNGQYRVMQETGLQWTHGQHAHTVPPIDQTNLSLTQPQAFAPMVPEIGHSSPSWIPEYRQNVPNVEAVSLPPQAAPSTEVAVAAQHFRIPQNIPPSQDDLSNAAINDSGPHGAAAWQNSPAPMHPGVGEYYPNPESFWPPVQIPPVRGTMNNMQSAAVTATALPNPIPAMAVGSSHSAVGANIGGQVQFDGEYPVASPYSGPGSRFSSPAEATSWNPQSAGIYDALQRSLASSGAYDISDMFPSSSNGIGMHDNVPVGANEVALSGWLRPGWPALPQGSFGSIEGHVGTSADSQAMPSHGVSNADRSGTSIPTSNMNFGTPDVPLPSAAGKAKMRKARFDRRKQHSEVPRKEKYHGDESNTTAGQSEPSFEAQPTFVQGSSRDGSAQTSSDGHGRPALKIQQYVHGSTSKKSSSSHAARAPDGTVWTNGTRLGQVVCNIDGCSHPYNARGKLQERVSEHLKDSHSEHFPSGPCPCPYSECKVKPLKDKKSLNRHIWVVHVWNYLVPSDNWCEVCEVPFARREGLAAHLKTAKHRRNAQRQT